MADPWNQPLIEELRFAAGARVQPVAAAPEALAAALLRAYGTVRPGVQTADPAGAGAAAPRVGQRRACRLDRAGGRAGRRGQQPRRPRARGLGVGQHPGAPGQRLIADAVRLRASDIHIETADPPRPVRVRLRIDGELVPTWKCRRSTALRWWRG
jgi:hypothetical protein